MFLSPEIKEILYWLMVGSVAAIALVSLWSIWEKFTEKDPD